MDTSSMAKVLGSVAGPSRIPQREAPYTPSDRLLLGGPFRSIRNGLHPVHTLTTPAGDQLADLSYAAFMAGNDGCIEIAPVAEPWDTVAATGSKATRRPTPARLKLLLEPEPRLRGTIDDRIARAYRTAFTLAFDEESKRLSDTGNAAILSELGRRRSGRPLGLAA